MLIEHSLGEHRFHHAVSRINYGYASEKAEDLCDFVAAARDEFISSIVRANAGRRYQFAEVATVEDIGSGVVDK